MRLRSQRMAESGVLRALAVGLVALFAVVSQSGPHTASFASRTVGGPVGQFAFADLDGDRKPDMASVEVAGQQASSTNYAVRLQFGAGTDSYIGVQGPFGGLRLVLRDVNGDNRLDVVLTSIADPRVIQILLNDGHGNFSAAAVSPAFSMLSESETALREPQAGPCDRLLLGVTRVAFEADVDSQQKTAPHDSKCPLGQRFQPTPFSSERDSRTGRSPPSNLTLS